MGIRHASTTASLQTWKPFLVCICSVRRTTSDMIQQATSPVLNTWRWHLTCASDLEGPWFLSWIWNSPDKHLQSWWAADRLQKPPSFTCRWGATLHYRKPTNVPLSTKPCKLPHCVRQKKKYSASTINQLQTDICYVHKANVNRHAQNKNNRIIWLNAMWSDWTIREDDMWIQSNK